MNLESVVRRNIRRIRRSQDLTLDQLSDLTQAAGMKILRTGLSKLENGAMRINVDHLMVLADALGVHPAELLTDNESYLNVYTAAVARQAARA